jgi:hypothetical protein
MKLVLLYLLCVIDAACSGYRAAAGRNALIYKGAYFRRAMRSGVLVGHVFMLLFGVLFLATHGMSADAAVEKASGGMLLVYIPYAIIIAAATVLRLCPSVDLKSIASVAIFGPLTFIRPPVAVLGLFVAATRSQSATVAVIGLAFVISMLFVEQILIMWWLPATDS